MIARNILRIRSDQLKLSQFSENPDTSDEIKMARTVVICFPFPIINPFQPM
jgi:hypothetical protein